MLPLINGNDLVDQRVKGFFFSDGSEGILNRVLKTDIKQKMLGFVVEVQGAMVCWNLTEYVAADLACLRRDNLARAWCLTLRSR